VRASVLLAYLLWACPGWAEGRAAVRDSVSLQQGKAAMWRSVALDGWGQAYNKERVKALLFSGAELAMLAGAYGQHQEWRDWDERRRRELEPAAQEYFATRADFYLRDRNKILWWWLWLKLASVLDAYVSGSLSNFDAGWGEQAIVEPVFLREDTPGVRVRLTLP